MLGDCTILEKSDKGGYNQPMISHRLEALKSKMTQEKLEAVLISSVANITYLTNYANFFKEERDGYVLITKRGNYILTHSIYSKSLEGKIPGFEVVEISRRDPPEKIIQKVLKNTKAQIGIEEHDLRVYEYKRLNKVFKNLKDFDFKIKRAIKDTEEIKLIAKACEIGDQVFAGILKKIKAGITEKQLAFEIDSAIRKEGFEPSFRTIVAFGSNAAHPHHQSTDKPLTINDEQSSSMSKLILMDFGVVYKNYCSDMTRTVFFGKASEEQKKMYETVLTSQQKAVEFINAKKGQKIKASDVDKIARDYILKQGFPSIPHSLGHGIGLEVHEHPHLSPKSKELLEEGMVFSIEPGIYLIGEGGVRVEDLYVLQNSKILPLTHSNSDLIEL